MVPILEPTPFSSFAGAEGGGLGGEKPMDMTSFRFFACMPGIVMDIGL